MADNTEKKMKIAIDIGHPAHVNFFKVAARRLLNDGHNVTIIYLDRGQLPLIVKEEFKEFKLVRIGLHRGSKLSVIFDANLRRFFQLFKYLNKNRFDIGLGVGSFNFGGVLKLFSLPNLQFDDDPERGLNTILEKLTATQLFFPPIIENYGNIRNFKALKEWAYLSPKYFTPNPSVLEEYGLKVKDYVFIREISTGSLNYSKQKANIIATFARDFDKSENVILSLENKKKAGYYPDKWQILEEPIKDIHSIIYYSKLVISSGDSMAREGAMLGVPSIYCGFRNMKANRILENKNILFHVKPGDVVERVLQLKKMNYLEINQKKFREDLKAEWSDVSELIYDAVMKYINNGKAD
ncbi:MAG TPA: DUF354 domain-containing protein [Ignavibacteria bacterium]|nr:DUF354 domain-containing protein [Ignavibacteria bacterium]